MVSGILPSNKGLVSILTTLPSAANEGGGLFISETIGQDFGAWLVVEFINTALLLVYSYNVHIF